MRPEEHVAHLRADGAALARAAAGQLTAPVPSCPGWTLADLVAHTLDVHGFWATIVEGRLTQPPTDDFARPPDDRLVDAYLATLEKLAGLLDGADPAEPLWTWSASNNHIGFVQRRTAHETAVHRWDAEAAVGEPSAIEAGLAVDGIDEFVEEFLGNPRLASRFEGGRRTIHLHCIDAEGEWLIETGGGAVTVRREHAKGDVAARGPASDLLLLLWGRRRAADVEVFGDGGVLDEFAARTSI